MLTFKRERQGCFCKVMSLLVVATFFTNFIIPVSGFAQTLNILPSPGSLVHLGPVYNPALLTGIQIYPENPLQIDFIVNDGDDNLKGEELKIQAEKMIKYFLASLTTPEKDLWVNLSPYEENRIISDTLAQTDIGRDLLAQDYILKQITASLIYPEDQLGKKFWDKIYKKAYEAYGTTEIPIDTFNKVWIMPDKVAVYEHGDMVFVAEASLKVMLETDYLARQEDRRQKTGDRKDTKTQEHRDAKNTTNLNNPSFIVHSPPSDFSKEIIREIVIPELEKEVNQGKNFASLRQVYHSLILAVWFKKTLKKSLLGQIYVDQNKLKGLDLDEEGIKEKIYQQYLEAYKKGAYNFIKPEYDPHTKKNIPRKYFSGGIEIAKEAALRMTSVSFPTTEQQWHIAGDDGNTKFQVALSSPMISRNGERTKIKRVGGIKDNGSKKKSLVPSSDDWDDPEKDPTQYLIGKFKVSEDLIKISRKGGNPDGEIIAVSAESENSVFSVIAPGATWEKVKNSDKYQWKLVIFTAPRKGTILGKSAAGSPIGDYQPSRAWRQARALFEEKEGEKSIVRQIGRLNDPENKNLFQSKRESDRSVKNFFGSTATYSYFSGNNFLSAIESGTNKKLTFYNRGTLKPINYAEVKKAKTLHVIKVGDQSIALVVSSSVKLKKGQKIEGNFAVAATQAYGTFIRLPRKIFYKYEGEEDDDPYSVSIGNQVYSIDDALDLIEGQEDIIYFEMIFEGGWFVELGSANFKNTEWEVLLVGKGKRTSSSISIVGQNLAKIRFKIKTNLNNQFAIQDSIIRQVEEILGDPIGIRIFTSNEPQGVARKYFYQPFEKIKEIEFRYKWGTFRLIKPENSYSSWDVKAGAKPFEFPQKFTAPVKIIIPNFADNVSAKIVYEAAKKSLLEGKLIIEKVSIGPIEGRSVDLGDNEFPDNVEEFSFTIKEKGTIIFLKKDGFWNLTATGPGGFNNDFIDFAPPKGFEATQQLRKQIIGLIDQGELDFKDSEETDPEQKIENAGYEFKVINDAKGLKEMFTPVSGQYIEIFDREDDEDIYKPENVIKILQSELEKSEIIDVYAHVVTAGEAKVIVFYAPEQASSALKFLKTELDKLRGKIPGTREVPAFVIRQVEEILKERAIRIVVHTTGGATDLFNFNETDDELVSIEFQYPWGIFKLVKPRYRSESWTTEVMRMPTFFSELSASLVSAKKAEQLYQASKVKIDGFLDELEILAKEENMSLKEYLEDLKGKKVVVYEMLRELLQNLKENDKFFDVDIAKEAIRRIVDSFIHREGDGPKPRLEVTSLTRARVFPFMRNHTSELVAYVSDEFSEKDAEFGYLVFKPDHVDEAFEDPNLTEISFVVGLASKYEAVNTQSNADQVTAEKSLSEKKEIIDRVRKLEKEYFASGKRTNPNPVRIRFYASNSFRYTYIGEDGKTYTIEIPSKEVVDRFKQAVAMGANELVICDTTGEAKRVEVINLIKEIKDGVNLEGKTLALHLHIKTAADLAKAIAAIKAGVDVIDTSILNQGGNLLSGDENPAGNLPTEDLLFALDIFGVETNIDREKFQNSVVPFFRENFDLRFLEKAKTFDLGLLTLAQEQKLRAHVASRIKGASSAVTENQKKIVATLAALMKSDDKSFAKTRLDLYTTKVEMKNDGSVTAERKPIFIMDNIDTNDTGLKVVKKSFPEIETFKEFYELAEKEFSGGYSEAFYLTKKGASSSTLTINRQKAIEILAELIHSEEVDRDVLEKYNPKEKIRGARKQKAREEAIKQIEKVVKENTGSDFFLSEIYLFAQDEFKGGYQEALEKAKSLISLKGDKYDFIDYFKRQSNARGFHWSDSTSYRSVDSLVDLTTENGSQIIFKQPDGDGSKWEFESFNVDEKDMRLLEKFPFWLSDILLVDINSADDFLEILKKVYLDGQSLGMETSDGKFIVQINKKGNNDFRILLKPRNRSLDTISGDYEILFSRDDNNGWNIKVLSPEVPAFEAKKFIMELNDPYFYVPRGQFYLSQLLGKRFFLAEDMLSSLQRLAGDIWQQYAVKVDSSESLSLELDPKEKIVEFEISGRKQETEHVVYRLSEKGFYLLFVELLENKENRHVARELFWSMAHQTHSGISDQELESIARKKLLELEGEGLQFKYGQLLNLKGKLVEVPFFLKKSFFDIFTDRSSFLYMITRLNGWVSNIEGEDSEDIVNIKIGDVGPHFDLPFTAFLIMIAEISDDPQGLKWVNRFLTEALKKVDNNDFKFIRNDDIKASSATPTGGIDLTEIYEDLNIKIDQSGSPLAIEFQNLNQIHIEGLMPVIINIVPILNLPVLLGFDRNLEKPTKSLAHADFEPMDRSRPFDYALKQ